MNIGLREAKLEDAKMVLGWRNSEEIRKYFFNSAVIDEDDHMSWFRKIIVSKKHLFFIAQKQTQPVGVLRFDLLGKEAEIDIYLKPGLSGQGIGSEILAVGIVWAKENLLNIERLVAKVVPDNIASCMLFDKAGFKVMYRCYKYDLS